MEIRTGQWFNQEEIDTELLTEEIQYDSRLYVFIDTIDENDEVKTWEDEDGDLFLIVHISRTLYNETEDKHELVKERVESALEELRTVA